MSLPEPSSPHSGARRRLPSLAVLIAMAFLLLPLRVPYPVGALPNPGPNVLVRGGPSGVDGAAMAVDAAGEMHLVWKESLAGEWGTYYSRSSDGVAWRTPVRVDSPGGNTIAVSIAVEREAVPSQGRLYVAYEQDKDIWLVTSTNGVAWSTPSRVDAAPTGVNSYTPAVAASNGRVWVAWADFRNPSQPRVYLRQSTDAGNTWGPEILQSEPDTLNIHPAVEAKGSTIVVVWEAFSPTGIASSRSDDGGVTWRRGFVARGAKSYEGLSTPDLFLDDLGVAHVVWTHSGYTLGGLTYRQWSHVYYAWSQNGTAWSAPVRIDDTTNADAYMSPPSIGGVGSILWVAWADNRTGTDNVYASWSMDGQRWGDAALNDNDLHPADSGSQQASPVLRTGGYGVFIAWQDYRLDPPGDLYFSTLQTSPIVITEVQDEPAAEARVEVYNTGRSAYSLAGVVLHAGATNVSLDALGSAPARSHLVVGASADADLRVPLDLGTEGALVWISHGVDVMASVGTGTHGPAPDPLPGESTARYAGALDYVGAWTRSGVPSFHQRNAVPPPNLNPALVLNEVLYNALAPSDRYVELAYRGFGAIDLTGYRLVGDAVWTISAGTVSEASRHSMVSAQQTAALFDSLAVGGDNLYLYDPQGRLLDMVGWSGPHTQGRSVARVVDGVGGTTAFDDTSAIANGWRFDSIAQPSFLELGPPAENFGDLGSTVEFDVQATSHAPSADYVNVLPPQAPTGWTVTFLHPDRTPLLDSPGDADALPDLGLMAPDTAVPFLVEVAIPLQGGPEDGGNAVVQAAFATFPWQAQVSVRVGIHPYVLVNRTVYPTEVYEEGSTPPSSTVASVTVSARGAGSAVPSLASRDVIFLVDSNSSINFNDPYNVRVDAVKAYIEMMRPQDRASLIGFHVSPWVVSNRPLTNATMGGKGDLEVDADSLACSPFCYNPMSDAFSYTRIDYAIEKANEWLLRYGDPRKERIEILFNDGPCYPACTNTTSAVSEAARNGIAIYTVGLGLYVDGAYLQGISDATGGKHYHADRPRGLVSIYKGLAAPRNDTAALDPNPADAVPMVEDALPLYITPRPGSYVDPVSGQPRDPSAIMTLADRRLLRWNVPKIAVGTAWSVRYNVTSSRTGLVDVALFPDSRLAYLGWDGRPVTQAIPRSTLLVHPKPTPPFVTATLPANGAANVPVDTLIGLTFSEAMDTSTVRWTVTPSVATTPWWPNAQTLFLNHTGLRECTTYVVEITQGNDTEGEALRPAAVPNPWSFSTMCVRPYVVSTSPAHNDATVALDALIVVWFSEPMDLAVTTVTIAPSLVLASMWDADGRTLTLSHAELFSLCTVYTVTASGQDRDGNAGLVGGPVPNPWSFGTVCPPPVRYTITRQPALGTVLVDDALYAVPTEFLWRPGEAHRIEVPDLESQGPSRLAFLAWDDGGARDHAITVGGTDLTITAAYLLQHPASLTIAGLPSARPATVSYTLFGAAGSATAYDAWSSWTDDGSMVAVTEIVAGATGERWATADATQWTVTGPVSATARYVHQFSAEVRTDGLEGRGASVRYTAFGAAGQGTAAPLWSAWVDAGTSLSVPDTLSVGARERYRTRDATAWSASGTLAVTVAYVHQFQVYVALVGTDATHTVSVAWRVDRAAARVSGVAIEWADWADAGTAVTFDNRTTGDVPRTAIDLTSITIDRAIDATIRYAESPAAPPAEGNSKPLLAAVFATVLMIVGAWSARRVPWPTGTRRQLRAFALASLPFVLAEVATGVVSLLTGLLSIPPLLGPGMVVDLGILVAGLAVPVYRVCKWAPPK